MNGSDDYGNVVRPADAEYDKRYRDDDDRDDFEEEFEKTIKSWGIIRDSTAVGLRTCFETI